VAVLTGQPLDAYRVLGPGESGAVPPGSARTITSVGAQHQLEISDHLTSTLGARYDDLSDVGSRLHPRAALVLRLGEPHILKVQYAEAFRPPTLQALHLPAFTSFLQRGNPDIRPETIRTAEIGYIYRRPRLTARATLFRSEADDLIGSVAGRSENITDFSYRGVELEVDGRLHRRLRLLANASAFHATDEKVVRGLEGAADRLFNVAVLSEVGRGVQVNARLHGIGDRRRNLTDTRPALGGGSLLDLGFKWERLAGVRGLALRGGVRNALDASVRAPAQGGTYLDDLPRPGRVVWISARWEM
jgi:outer membrane receptor for ferrienterochelin and colicins